MLGRCYCKHKQGHPDRNEVMCSTNGNFKQLDLCNEGEGCIGPKTPEKAKSFLSADFCLYGRLKTLKYRPIG